METLCVLGESYEYGYEGPKGSRGVESVHDGNGVALGWV